MARIRSPNYPAISLPDALQRVAQVFAKDRQHLAPREVIIKGMGYSGVHGASLSAFSAALKYGLIDQEGKDYRVSQRAVAILHPHNPAERADAIREASLGPALFSELVQHFQGELPSDDNLRAYLVRRGFSESALGDVIKSFRETIDLVAKETGGYTPATAIVQQAESSSMERGITVTTEQLAPKGGFEVKAMVDRLVVGGTLFDQQTADKLISFLEMAKAMLPVSRSADDKSEKPN